MSENSRISLSTPEKKSNLRQKLESNSSIKIETKILDTIIFRFFLDININIHPIRLYFILEESHWYLIDFHENYKNVSFVDFIVSFFSYIIKCNRKKNECENDVKNLFKNSLFKSAVAKNKISYSRNNYNNSMSSISSFSNYSNNNSSKISNLSSNFSTSDSYLNDKNSYFNDKNITNDNFNKKDCDNNNLYQNTNFCYKFISSMNSNLKSFYFYKNGIPVFGAIIFSPNFDHVLLNKGYGKRGQFLFPRGKKEFDENGKEAAIREIYEEVGLDIRNKVLDIMICPRKEKFSLLIVLNQNMNIKIETKTRNEILEIRWVKIDDILKGKSEFLQVRNIFMKIEKQLEFIKQKMFRLDREKILKYF